MKKRKYIEHPGILENWFLLFHKRINQLEPENKIFFERFLRALMADYEDQYEEFLKVSEETVEELTLKDICSVLAYMTPYLTVKSRFLNEKNEVIKKRKLDMAEATFKKLYPGYNPKPRFPKNELMYRHLYLFYNEWGFLMDKTKVTKKQPRTYELEYWYVHHCLEALYEPDVVTRILRGLNQMFSLDGTTGMFLHENLYNVLLEGADGDLHNHPRVQQEMFIWIKETGRDMQQFCDVAFGAVPKKVFSSFNPYKGLNEQAFETYEHVIKEITKMRYLKSFRERFHTIAQIMSQIR